MWSELLWMFLLLLLLSSFALKLLAFSGLVGLVPAVVDVVADVGLVVFGVQ